MTDIILKADHLRKIFISGKKSMTAVDDVSFELKRGECLGIVGESGSGKSTIAKMITHLESITEGQVFLKGKDITNARGKDLREIYQDIQMVFQMPMESFDPRRTLGDGIGESLRNMGISRAETRKRVENLLERCGLDAEYADRYPHQVSGGQCQRAAIARALAVSPDILICDEPTTALDVTIQAQIIRLIKKLQKQYGYTIIFITHDLGVVANVADRVAIMYSGQIIEYGTVNEIFYEPKHPYTWGLLSSLPQLGIKGEPLYAIHGTPPSLYDEIKGDAFAPRSDYAMEIDFEEEPPMFKVSDTHYAKTWLLDPRAPKVEPPAQVSSLHERMKQVIAEQEEH